MAANKRHNRAELVYRIVFCVYLLFLFYFLFFSEKMGRLETGAEYRYNLTLFREIRRFCKYREVVGYKAFFLNVFGNVIAFVPFGMLMPRLSGRTKNGLVVTAMALELSFAVEVLQLVLRLGSFDVDDLLLNTVGGLLGYAIYAIVWNRTKRQSRRR